MSADTPEYTRSSGNVFADLGLPKSDELLAKATGRTSEEIRLASRVDNWMDAVSARDFGLVDHILTSATSKA